MLENAQQTDNSVELEVGLISLPRQNTVHNHMTFVTVKWIKGPLDGKPI